MKKLIKDVLIQIIPVMIGVYLGFALNNFGEQRKLDKQKAVFQQMLANEIEQNLKEVKEKYPYHEQLKKDLLGILNGKQIKKDFDNYRFTGFRTGKVNDSAYNTGIQTGMIQEFDLKLVQHLNRLYNLQENYSTFSHDLISGFMAKDFPETEQEIKSLLISLNMNMNDILNFEHELSEYYAMVLKKL